MKNFLLITGPIAVGKMTVGQELTRRLGYPLLINHHSIELALQFAGWGTPEFKAINNGVRELIYSTMATSNDIAGMTSTLVWGFELEEDWVYVATLRKKFEDAGWRFYIVELSASLDQRLLRNKTENRLIHKPSKRDLERSEKGLLEFERDHQMNSTDRLPAEKDYLRIDNTHLRAAQVAEQIIAAFGFIPIAE